MTDDRLGNADRPATERSTWSELLTTEDWWAVWIGGLILAVAFTAVLLNRPADIETRLEEIEEQSQKLQQTRTATGATAEQIEAEEQVLADLRSSLAPNPLKTRFSKLQRWQESPLDAFRSTEGEVRVTIVPRVLAVFGVALVLFGIGSRAMGGSFVKFGTAFVFVFVLTILAYVLANQALVKHYNLEYPLWALLVGLLISNTIGTPEFVKPAVQTEFYIKTGLVLLGAKILLSRLLALGAPGIFVAWVVTPIVLITTYTFGQKILRISSKSLNMTISADMSVCGVSAAIATAAACKAKKEELSLAIGMSLTFTVVMMTVMPAVIRFYGMSEVLGGAWMGGTIDATGAVAAAGAFLGGEAEQVAITVKMIQNILIGVIAFGVAVYWVIAVEESPSGRRPSIWEIWYRFPKFVLGFVAASIVFSLLSGMLTGGQFLVDSMIKGTTDVLRGWFFCLAFVSIGLETNFAELAKFLKGGRPLVLYVVGQTLNLCLTLFMAWLMFEVVFRESVQELVQ